MSVVEQVAQRECSPIDHETTPVASADRKPGPVKPEWLMLPLSLFRIHGARLGAYNWRAFAHVFGYCRAYGGECWPSIATIAKDCRMSPRQVVRSLQQLEKDDLLKIIDRPRPGKLNLTNVYRLTAMAETRAVPFRQVLTNAAETLKPIEFALLSAVLAGHDDRTGIAAVTIRQAAYLGNISIRGAYAARDLLAKLGYLSHVGNGKFQVSDLALHDGGIPHGDLQKPKRRASGPSVKCASQSQALMTEVHLCKCAPQSPDRERIPSTSSSSQKGKRWKKEEERKARGARLDASREPVFSDLFERFWESYPNKVKKRFAWEAWKRAGLERDGAAREALQDYLDDMLQSDDWSAEGGKFIPNAESLLDRGLWRNTSPAINEHGCFTRPRRVTTQEALAALGSGVGNG